MALNMTGSDCSSAIAVIKDLRLLLLLCDENVLKSTSGGTSYAQKNKFP